MVLYARRLVALLLVLVFVFGCSRKSRSSSDGASGRPEPQQKADTPSAPEAAADPVIRLTGRKLIERITSSNAKGTLVNAWASWCGPCRREFPMLVSLQDNLQSQGVDVVFISVDEPESEGAALDFAEQNGVSPPVFVADRPLGPFKKALNPKWPGMLPATFLFDSKGKLRYFWGGPVYEQELLPVIEGFLAGKAIDGEANFGLIPGKDFREQ